MDFPVNEITIYHKKKEKEYELFHVQASVRHNSILNHNRNGANSVENVIIRIFDIEGYNSKWKVEKDDVIVNLNVKDTIDSAVYSELKKKYSTENVFVVKEVNKFIFDDEDLDELSHIKLGCD